jgi:hypothetical protein
MAVYPVINRTGIITARIIIWATIISPACITIIYRAVIITICRVISGYYHP